MLRNYQFIYTARDLLEARINGWRGWLCINKSVGKDGYEGMVESIIRTNLLIDQLFRETLHLLGKRQRISKTSGCGSHALGQEIISDHSNSIRAEQFSHSTVA